MRENTFKQVAACFGVNLRVAHRFWIYPI